MILDLFTAGEFDLPVLAPHWRPFRVWCSAAHDAAMSASTQDLQARTTDEESGARSSQGIQGDLPGQWSSEHF